MPDIENDIADCVGAIYEAAANGGSWQDVGMRLRRLTDAQRAQLRIADRDGAAHNIMMPPDEGEAIYLAYYHPLNPYLVQARRDFAEARTHHLGKVMLGPELVPEQAFLRSEYYCDFPHGRVARRLWRRLEDDDAEHAAARGGQSGFCVCGEYDIRDDFGVRSEFHIRNALLDGNDCDGKHS